MGRGETICVCGGWKVHLSRSFKGSFQLPASPAGVGPPLRTRRGITQSLPSCLATLPGPSAASSQHSQEAHLALTSLFQEQSQPCSDV